MNVAIDEQAVVGQLRIDRVRPAHGGARRFQSSLEASVQQQTRHRRKRVRDEGLYRFPSVRSSPYLLTWWSVPRRSSLLDKSQ